MKKLISDISSRYKFLKSKTNSWLERIGFNVDDFVYKNKTALIAIAFFLGISLSGLFNYSVLRNRKISYRNTVSALTDSIKVISIDKNTLAFQKAAIELEYKELSLLSETKDKNISELLKTIDKLKKAKVDPVFVTTVVTETSGSITPDTVKMYPFNTDTTVVFSDEHLNAKISLVSDSAKFGLSNVDYSVSIPLSVSLSKDGKVSVVTGKNIIISSLDSWVDPALLRKKRNRFSVGVQSGVGLTGGGFGPYLGVGVTYNLINF